MATVKDSKKIRALRALIKEHKIVFRGVEPKSAWPQAYAPLFQKIFDADRRWYGQFLQSGGLEPVERDYLKQQVDQVVRKVNSCRQDWDIESTWRMRIERYITGRFERETNCTKCSRIMPAKRARYLSQRAFEPHEFESRPRIRRECTCITTENYEDRFETGEVDLFNIKADSKVCYFDHQKLRDSGVPETKPDCMVGLAMTESMKKCVTYRNDLQHYPYLSHQEMVYPFLLIEAKSEKGSPGFVSIEAQSAFPIMTMLQLQAQLETDSGSPIAPLVWFIAYAGGDVRLYGCVKASERFEIFELWHGSLSYHDKVFRLFYIVDLLCDWAREYRRMVQARLVPNHQQLREWTPASTTLSSQDATQTVSATDELAQDQTDADQQMEGLHIADDWDRAVDSPMEIARSCSEDESEEDPSQESLTEHKEQFQDNSGRSLCFAIRHIDSVKFLFRHTILHDSTIRKLSAADFSQIKSMTRHVLVEGSLLELSNDSLRSIEAAWLGVAPHRLATPLRGKHLCLVKLSTFFDPRDLLPVRCLFCISLPTRLLTTIYAEEPVSTSAPDVSSGLQAERFVQEFALMCRSLSRRDSVYSSLMGIEYHLMPNRPPTLEEPRLFPNLVGDPTGVKHSLFKCVATIATTQNRHRSAVRTPFPGQQSMPISIPKDFGVRDNFVIGSHNWTHENCPDFVILVASDDVFEYPTIRHKLPHILRDVINRGSTYRAEHGAEIMIGSLSSEDIVPKPCRETLEMTKRFRAHIETSI